ncbi:hypothetical protein BJ085DRAFT_29927 [Dimargaris cristalligena]|uniref:Uncharacterized protein n=1 Tax=Dimargaris cristalligena TaxID=215637 RepID=A0A4P9ZUA1_9FUNG|nr:hypothetical protein BJ085DRAFT_29927 [Dimargaris cristalligena]|eukprot:RKP36362.1 hypothetical protein BJ085DRAFT_29927 [Dimargaris cristalligena]
MKSSALVLGLVALSFVGAMDYAGNLRPASDLPPVPEPSRPAPSRPLFPRTPENVVEQQACDRHLQLWALIAPLETWDIYLRDVRSALGSMEEAIQRGHINAQNHLGPPSSNRQLVADYTAFMKDNAETGLFDYNNRQAIRLSSLVWVVFQAEFPLASRATGSMLADLIKWLASAHPSNLLPLLNWGSTARGELQTHTLRSYLNRDRRVFEDIFDQVITIGLWRLYMQAVPSLLPSNSPLTDPRPPEPVPSTSQSEPSSANPPPTDGQSEPGDVYWSEIMTYFRLVSEYATQASRHSSGKVYDTMGLVYKHSHFVAILAALAKRTDHLEALLPFFYFKDRWLTAQDPDLRDDLSGFLHNLDMAGFHAPAAFIRSQWPTLLQPPSLTPPPPPPEPFTLPDGRPLRNKWGMLPYFNSDYQWLDENGELFVTVPEAKLRHPQRVLWGAKNPPIQEWNVTPHDFRFSNFFFGQLEENKKKLQEMNPVTSTPRPRLLKKMSKTFLKMTGLG